MIEEYLRNELKKSGWHFVPFIPLLNEIKKIATEEEIRAELNRLYLEKKIKKRAGINGDLIEIIDKNL